MDPKLVTSVPHQREIIPTFDPTLWTGAFGSTAPAGSVAARQLIEYGVDACERSVLFLDIMRQRGNNHFEHQAEAAPNVLNFPCELVIDGRQLERPVNYGLVRIRPPGAGNTDPKKRPYVVFDPRAGHGPGIGGMKHDSEIGVIAAAGHPCYFVGFLPEPMPGQTVEDVCRAEAIFVQKVVELHPEAEGKPCLIGNCQAGWQIAMMASLRPDLVGPLMLAGTPLSYWNGVHGKNPLRYLGGLLGGTWLASLAGDLGAGKFDGAYLVANFESLNPANTYWEKAYNVYAKVDTEGPRFLEFETWWGSPVLLNAQEMQFIADELFVGNKLTSGELYTSDGMRVDLRNIKSPIIVFCSFGDNITPPQQALGWILDLYGHDEEIVANGQTIIYTLHQTIGHLGIFVSAKVATKEHQELTATMDLIDILPPGLYEAVMTEKGTDTSGTEFMSGNYIVRFEPRTLAHIRALGGNDAEDDLRFATVARVSEINQGLYRTFLSPLVRMLSSEQSAKWLRSMHPYRLRYEAFSDQNPLARQLAPVAKKISSNRRPVESDNPFLAAQNEASRQIVRAFDLYQNIRDGLIESWFMAVYGSPFLQAMVGLRADATSARQRIGRDVLRQVTAEKAAATIETQFEKGGTREAAIRAIAYIGLAREKLGVDERAFGVLRQIRARTPDARRMSLAQVKALIREQFHLLRHDEERAIAAIPKLLADDAAERKAALDDIRQVVAAPGPLSDLEKRRLARIEALFEQKARSIRKGTDTAFEVAAIRSQAETSALTPRDRQRQPGREPAEHK